MVVAAAPELPPWRARILGSSRNTAAAHGVADRSSTRAMSDFTDDEDRQLVQLARLLSEPRAMTADVDTAKARSPPRRQINWDALLQMMVGTHKSKAALRQRLKTLKRKHNTDLGHFPDWYFKKRFDNTAHAAWHADSPVITPPPRQPSRPRKTGGEDVWRRILVTSPGIDEAQVKVEAESTSTPSFVEDTFDHQTESSLWALAVAAEIRSSANSNSASQTKASIRFLLSHDAA